LLHTGDPTPSPASVSVAKPALSLVNFRPNIVVTQCEAFAEDSWKEIEICDPSGDRSVAVPLSIVKPCSRCKMPNIHPFTAEIPSSPSLPEEGPGEGEADEGERFYVTKAMQAYRTGDMLQFYPQGEDGTVPNRWGKSVFFGQNAEPKVKSGVIVVGDVIRVSQFRQR
jgi:uncharacterized protein YcbX